MGSCIYCSFIFDSHEEFMNHESCVFSLVMCTTCLWFLASPFLGEIKYQCQSLTDISVRDYLFYLQLPRGQVGSITSTRILSSVEFCKTNLGVQTHLILFSGRVNFNSWIICMHIRQIKILISAVNIKTFVRNFTREDTGFVSLIWYLSS